MKRKIDSITGEAARRATKLGHLLYERGAKSAHLENGRMLVVEMRNGSIAAIPIAEIPIRVIAQAPTAKLKVVEVGPMGDHVWFPKIDEGYNVAALLELGFGATMSSDAGRRGGAQKNPAKFSAARVNGARGGWPKKIAKA